MTIKLSYFLAKKRCTLDKYVRVNNIKTYAALCQHLSDMRVELPDRSSSTVRGIFNKKSQKPGVRKPPRQQVKKEVIVTEKPKKTYTAKKSSGRSRTRRKKKA